MPRQEPSGLEPQCVALLVCDLVHRDPISRRYTVLGIFDAIEAPFFPVVYPKMSVFLSMIDGRGITRITLRLVDVDELRPPVFEYSANVDFSDPRMPEEIGLEIQDAAFPERGEYRLQMLASNATIVERSLTVDLAPDAED